jgi:hypothetical protein
MVHFNGEKRKHDKRVKEIAKNKKELKNEDRK